MTGVNKKVIDKSIILIILFCKKGCLAIAKQDSTTGSVDLKPTRKFKNDNKIIEIADKILKL